MKKFWFFAASLVLSIDAHAASTIAKVDKINVGGNGKHGTFIAMVDKVFSECGGSVTAVFLNGDPNINQNYKEQLSVVLSAKVSDKDIIVAYSGCDGAYPVVQEITMP